MKRLDIILRSAALATSLLAFAFTDAVAQYQRIVLLEEYTSVTCEPCAIAGRNLNDVVADNPSRVTSIRYHNNFIGPKDRFFEANKSENAARHAYYGWIGMPRVRVNGTIDIQGTDRGELDARISDELANESPVMLEVEQTVVDAVTRMVTIKVTAGPDGLESGMLLYAAAVEARVHEPLFANSPYNGEVDVHDIMRDMLPDANGEQITLGANEVKNFVYSYQIGEGWQADEMYAIAFVQDDFDKSIQQVGFSARPVSSIEAVNVDGYSAHMAIPNPATDRFHIEYTLGRAGSLSCEVRNVEGTVVRTIDVGVRNASQSSVEVDVSGLPAGMYVCTLSSGAWRWNDRVMVVR